MTGRSNWTIKSIQEDAIPDGLVHAVNYPKTLIKSDALYVQGITESANVAGNPSISHARAHIQLRAHIPGN
jgi:hypothetical protein